MAKVVLIFDSTTGNTEMLSEHVAAGLEQGMATVTVKNSCPSYDKSIKQRCD